LNTTGNVEVIYGIDLKSFEALAGPFNYMAGGPFTGPDTVIVDDWFAAGNNVGVGSKLTMFNHEVTVCAVVEHGRGARKFLPMKTLQDWLGAQGKASVFYVKLDDPKMPSWWWTRSRVYPACSSTR
jgi:putative ABC transport system permease protein